jgi:hypothetical protein
MSRFMLGLIATILASGLLLAQLAASFAVIRFGCIVLLFAMFLGIAIDAAIDKAKASAQGYDGELITVITPHIGYAIVLTFLIIVGVAIGL